MFCRQWKRKALLVMVFSCLGYSHFYLVKDELTNWINDYNLIYAKTYIEAIQADPEKYLSLAITFTSIYMIVCIIFIYGAYTCSNMLMVMYILMELLRLILISTLVATCLLLIKQNTMDIGLLIGASVSGGILLLGMFYLWVCTANLPIVINEMERDEQAAVIAKLQKLLKVNNQRTVPRGIVDNIPFSAQSEDIVNKGVFIVPRKRTMNRKRNSEQIPLKKWTYFKPNDDDSKFESLAMFQIDMLGNWFKFREKTGIGSHACCNVCYDI